MAEETVTEITKTNVDSLTEDMDLVENSEANGGKRAREEAGEEENDVSKRQKADKSVEEERLENLEGGEGDGDGYREEKEESGPVNLGPKTFGSSVEMFDYFFKLVHAWPVHLNINKYEYMVLLELLKKGHPEPEKKIGTGIQAFQVRNHPLFKSKCFFLIRDDGSVDDFSFRKCVDHILPLPEDMKVISDANKSLGKGHGGRGGGGRGGRGRGRGFGKKR